MLASAGSDGTVRLWNLDGSARGQPLQGHEGSVLSVAFSPNGDLLASAGEDGAVRSWGIQSGKQEGLYKVGLTLHKIGFLKRSVWTMSHSGQLFFARLDLHPKAHMILDHQGLLAYTANGWYSGHGDPIRSVRLYTESGERLSEADAARRLAPEEVKAAITGERPFLPMCWAILVRSWQRTWEGYNALPGWLRVALWPASFYVASVLVLLTLWLFRPAVLAGWAMPDIALPKPPDWKEVRGLFKLLSLIWWLGGTQRALDAWLGTNNSRLLDQCFAGKKSVQERGTYVDLGNEADIAAWQEAVRAAKEAAVWITGSGGGSGKSTLAFQLAKTCLGNSQRHPVVPILLEEDWKTDELVDHIAVRLGVDSRRPTVEMVKKLGHSGRLLPIVDGLSERNVERGSEQVRELLDKRFFKCLLVTSRDTPPDKAEFRNVEVGPLSEERLNAFVQAYYTNADWEKAVETLKTWAKGRAISPLFAFMAIKQLREGKKLPGNDAALVTEYVDSLRPEGAGALREEDFSRAARFVAYVCVVKFGRPGAVTARAVSEDYLRGRLEEPKPAMVHEDGDESTSVVVLDQLVQCGLIQKQKSETGQWYVRFAQDPIAEYLAAMHLVNLEGKDAANIRDWKAFKGSGFEAALTRVMAAQHQPADGI